MLYGNSKQVVIIKNIKSNFIEEAIFVLKHQHGKHFKNSKNNNVDLSSSDYIIQEAQNIIDNYTKQYYSAYKSTNAIPSQKKTKTSKKRGISFNMILNISLFISIAVFIFLVSRLF